MKSTIDNLRRMTGLAHTEILQNNSHPHHQHHPSTSSASMNGKGMYRCLSNSVTSLLLTLKLLNTAAVKFSMLLS